MTLTALQRLVLEAAAAAPSVNEQGTLHGVFRSLVIRGLLMPVPRGYSITPEGRAALTGPAVSACRRSCA